MAEYSDFESVHDIFGGKQGTRGLRMVLEPRLASRVLPRMVFS